MRQRLFLAPLALSLFIVGLLCLDPPALAWWQSIQQISVGGASATTTWNPSDKNANISLSPDNLTATNSTTANRAGVRSVANASSGKKFWKLTVNDVDLASGEAIGTANSTFSLSTDFSLTAGGSGVFGDGSYYDNAAFVSNIDAFATSDVVSVALDIGNAKIWFKVNSGNWNNNAMADPATNTGGLTVTITGALYALICLRFFGVGASAQMTADFSGTGAPSGFGSW